MSWTDERVEQLKGLWGQHKSASQIARAIGNVSRNAVIGKLNRLGLMADGTGRSRNPPRMGGGMRKPRASPAPKPQPLSRERIAELLATDLPPTDDPLSPKGCRWPIGEIGAADFRFCQRPRGTRHGGAPSSWCEGHHALGHQNQAPRKLDSLWNWR